MISSFLYNLNVANKKGEEGALKNDRNERHREYQTMVLYVLIPTALRHSLSSSS
jgi:hypothetical protein